MLWSRRVLAENSNKGPSWSGGGQGSGYLPITMEKEEGALSADQAPLQEKREGQRGDCSEAPGAATLAPHLSSLPWKLTSGQRQTVISRTVLIPGPALHPDS